MIAEKQTTAARLKAARWLACSVWALAVRLGGALAARVDRAAEMLFPVWALWREREREAIKRAARERECEAAEARAEQLAEERFGRERRYVERRDPLATSSSRTRRRRP